MGLKALLVGINKYDGRPLHGCVNDVRAMARALRRRYGVAESDIQILEDLRATRASILDGIRWLANGTAAGDMRLFHYSGHGTFVPAQPGDDEEETGQDQCLVPIDHYETSLLKDDELGKEYTAFHRDSRLTLLMDCCHSGTIHKLPKPPPATMRLRFSPPPRRIQREVRLRREKLHQDKLQKMLAAAREPGADPKAAAREALRTVRASVQRKYGITKEDERVILLAGCQDDQTSAEDLFESEYHGALTYGLLKRLAQGPASYEALHTAVSAWLKKRSYPQVPELRATAENSAAPFLGKTPIG